MDLEKLILSSLQNGPLLKTELIERVKEKRPGTTKQGIYRALKRMASEEKLVLKQKSAALDLNWIFEAQQFLANVQFHYGNQPENSLNFLTLKNKISYTFSTLVELDTFANQVLHILNIALPAKEPLFVYNPHQWFFYSRNKYEQNLLAAMGIKNRTVLVSLVHRDPLNVNLRHLYTGEKVQYGFESKLITKKSNYYFVVFGEFLVEFTIDPVINKKLDLFFKKHGSLTNEAQKEVDSLVHEPGKHKMTITKGSRKVEVLRQHLSKKFVLPK